MTDPVHEQISSALDGELPRIETEWLVRRLVTDADLRRRWERYHLISDVLKNNLPPVVERGFADRTYAALVAIPPLSRSLGFVRAWLKPIAGVAVAASVAVLTVIAAQMLYTDSTPQPLGVAGVKSGLMPVVSPQVVDMSQATDEADPDDLAPGLNNYLLSHSGHSMRSGMQGMLPYVRIVGYDVSE